MNKVMTMVTIEILVLSIFTMIMAIGALEAEKLSRSIVMLALSSIGIGTIFMILGATYAALFQYMLYAGVLIILFMVVASFMEEENKEAIVND